MSRRSSRSSSHYRDYDEDYYDDRERDRGYRSRSNSSRSERGRGYRSRRGYYRDDDVRYSNRFMAAATILVIGILCALPFQAKDEMVVEESLASAPPISKGDKSNSLGVRIDNMPVVPTPQSNTHVATASHGGAGAPGTVGPQGGNGLPRNTEKPFEAGAEQIAKSSTPNITNGRNLSINSQGSSKTEAPITPVSFSESSKSTQTKSPQTASTQASSSSGSPAQGSSQFGSSSQPKPAPSIPEIGEKYNPIPESSKSPPNYENLELRTSAGGVMNGNINVKDHLPFQRASESGSSRETTHRVRDGETLQSIAERYYGDARMAEKIQQANEAVLVPNQPLQIGIELNLPKLDGE